MYPCREPAVPAFMQASHLLQRRCWAVRAAFIYHFEVASIPLMVCVLYFGNISSLNFFLSQEWESVNDIRHWTRTEEGLTAKTSDSMRAR